MIATYRMDPTGDAGVGIASTAATVEEFVVTCSTVSTTTDSSTVSFVDSSTTVSPPV